MDLIPLHAGVWGFCVGYRKIQNAWFRGMAFIAYRGEKEYT